MADVSCRRCGEGFWVTGRAEWTTCPECPDDVALSGPEIRDGERAVAWLALGMLLTITVVSWLLIELFGVAR